MKMHILNGGRLRMRKSVYLPDALRGETIVLPVSCVLLRHPQGNVLFVRFYEGEGAGAVYSFDGNLTALMGALVDVPVIVNTMPQAIRLAVVQSRQ